MSVELDIRHTDVESGRRRCGARFAILEDLLWRATERDTVRNMVSMENRVKKLQRKARSRVKWDGVGGCYSRTEKYPQVGNKSVMVFATPAFFLSNVPVRRWTADLPYRVA